MSSNTSLYTPQISTSSSVIISAVPLALALNSIMGLKSLIRSDFMSNLKLDEFKKVEDDVYSNIKYLWKWFECKYFYAFKIFEKKILNFIY